MSDNIQNDNNPFVILSDLFIENQRQLNVKSDELIKRLSTLNTKLSTLKTHLENDIFTANLVLILNIEEESKLILGVAKELEFQRDQINTSVNLLKDSKKIKLNK